jgi:hypothetical protein
MGAINEKVHEKIMAQKSRKEIDRAEVNAKLFHLLLTFAIRMGFHIGQMELNAVNGRQINLHTFVHAQNCIEEIHPSLKDNR